MPRGWILYLITVAAPVGIGSVLAASVQSAALAPALAAPDLEAGKIAIGLLRLDIERTTESLFENAAPLADPDPSSGGVRAALDGDTVASLGVADRRMIATLFAPGPEGSVLHAEEVLRPTFPEILEGYAGFEAALYLNGVRSAGTDAGFGPDALGADLLERLSGAPEGIVSPPGQRGALVPMEPTPGRTPAVVVLAAPSLQARAEVSAIGWPFGLLVALAVAVLGFWALRDTAGRAGGVRVALLVPLLALWVGLALLQLGYLRDVEGGRAGPVELAAAVVPALGDDVSAARVREVTGYATTVIADGTVTDAAPPEALAEPAVGVLANLLAAGERTGVLTDGATRYRFATASLGRGDVVVLAPDAAVGMFSGPATRLLVLGLVISVVCAWFAALRPRSYRSKPSA